MPKRGVIVFHPLDNRFYNNAIRLYFKSLGIESAWTTRNQLDAVVTEEE